MSDKITRIIQVLFNDFISRRIKNTLLFSETIFILLLLTESVTVAVKCIHRLIELQVSN